MYTITLFVPRLPWLAPCGRWNFLRDTGVVHRITLIVSLHYLFMYLFICIWGATSELVQL